MKSDTLHLHKNQFLLDCRYNYKTKAIQFLKDIVWGPWENERLLILVIKVLIIKKD